MFLFSNLEKAQKEAVGLLSLGTFLEYFDIMLYVHMGVLLNALFSPLTDTHTAALITAFSFCSTYILRPFGALIFGQIGDRVGRKSIVVFTTFIMSVSCLTMAYLPTYAQIGITASWVVTICRALQGISSMGEVIGAELYLTEITKPPYQYPIVGLIGFAVLGSMAALGVALFAIYCGFNWRIAFFLGAGIAIIGAFARTRLKETLEFVNAKRALEKRKLSPKPLQSTTEHAKSISKQTSLAFFFIQCSWPVVFYFTYIYCSGILKHSFGYTPEKIIGYNFLLASVHLIRKTLKCYLSIKIYPLKILKGMLGVFSFLTLACPYFLDIVQTPYQLFVLQSFVLLFGLGDVPAVPIFFKHFPVLKRFTYTSFIYALSRVLVYVTTSFGLIYLTKYWGNWGLLVIFAPLCIGYGFALLHFEQLELEAGNYPLKHASKFASMPSK